MNKAEAKDKQHKGWTMVAPGWGKHDALMRAWTAPATGRMIALAGICTGSRAPRRRAVSAQTSNFAVSMARPLAPRPVPSIVVTMRWGLMFMPDPVACMRRAHAAFKRYWTEAANNPFVTVPLGVLKRHMEIPDPPAGAPGIFALASSDRLREIFAEAGFRDVAIEQVTLPMADFATGAEYDEFIRELAGPVASLFVQLPADKQAIVKQEIAREAEARSSKPGRVYLHGITHVVVGTR